MIMDYFTQLDKILDIPQGVAIGFWYDFEIINAGDLIKKFKDDDWKKLAETWRDRNRDWIQRCAEILDSSQNQVSFNILMEMIEYGDIEIVMAATYSLSNFPSRYIKQISDAKIDFLERYLKSAKVTEATREGVLLKLDECRLKKK